MSFYTQPRMRLHDLTHSPAGLWQFQGDALDTSGNSLNLTWNNTEAYTIALGTVMAANFDGTSYLQRAAAGALQIAGDVTVEFLASYMGLVGVDTALVNKGIISMAASGELESENFLYSVFAQSAGTGLLFFAEFNAGDNISFNSLAGPPPFQTWHHFAMVRTSDVITLFLNGVLVDTSGTLTTPTGGTIAFLNVGAGSAGVTPIRMSMASLKIIASALTPAQVLAEARLCGFA